eukprot:1307701-Prymnesium_polylepis.1
MYRLSSGKCILRPLTCRDLENSTHSRRNKQREPADEASARSIGSWEGFRRGTRGVTERRLSPSFS